MYVDARQSLSCNHADEWWKNGLLCRFGRLRLQWTGTCRWSSWPTSLATRRPSTPFASLPMVCAPFHHLFLRFVVTLGLTTALLSCPGEYLATASDGNHLHSPSLAVR